MKLTQRVVVVDLEGTLTDCSHRLHHLQQGDFDAWNEGLALDPPNAAIIEMVALLECKYSIVIATAKPGRYKRDIKAWLGQHLPFEAGVFSREEGDMSASVDLKKKMVRTLKRQGFNIHLAIDDRQDICDMYHRENIPTLKVVT